MEKGKIRKKAEWKAGIMDFNGLEKKEIKKRLFIGKFDIFSESEKDEIISEGIKNYKP